VIDYFKPIPVKAVHYTARGDSDHGHVKDYEIYLSNDTNSWGTVAAKGQFNPDDQEQAVKLPQPVKARYMKFVALSEQEGRPWATVAELEAEEAK
jgi:beta-galactosidase